MTAMHIVNAILWLLAAAALTPMLVFCAECLAALLPWRGRHSCLARAGRQAPRPRAAVLIPAHDEQAVIEPTIRALLPALAPGDRLLVVADNCSDQTAELAHRAGADVVERFDSQRRGKGYALQHGIETLAGDPPDVVVVVDADCLAAPGTVEMLAQAAARTQRPTQAMNLTDRNPAVEAMQVVSTLANRFTNLVRPLGLRRLGLPCRLMGTGMALPWSLAGRIADAGGNLVEDMQLGIDLALDGHPPLFCPEARVTSALPADGQAFVSQRTRWEQGHLHTAVRQVPRLLAAAVRRPSWALLGMALDLSIPPLTLLVGLWFAAAMLVGLAGWLGASWLPAAVLLVGGAVMALAVTAGWMVFCRQQVPWRAVAGIPRYMTRKIPIYARFVLHPEHTWVRTHREPAAAHHESDRVVCRPGRQDSQPLAAAGDRVARRSRRPPR